MTTEHVDSVKTYAAVWIALLLMTALTTSVAYIDLGRFSVVVALTIAAGKMLQGVQGMQALPSRIARWRVASGYQSVITLWR